MGKTKTTPSLIIPTPAVIRDYAVQFETTPDYYDPQQRIADLVKLYPTNVELYAIWAKVLIINQFYGTAIRATYVVAQKILESNIDLLLASGGTDAVDLIRRVPMKKKTFDFYSFATKYCAFHQPILYPMYDSYIEEVLVAYQRNSPFSQFRRPELRNYRILKRVLLDFRTHFELTSCGTRELDHFLWLYGKQVFPKQ